MEKIEISKKELKGHDAFVTQMGSFINVLEKNVMVIGALVLAGILAIGVYLGYEHFRQSKEDKAQLALFQATTNETETRSKFDASESPLAQAVKKNEKKDKKEEAKAEEPKVKATGNLEVDYKEALGLYRNVISEHKGTQAAVLAGISLGKLYYEHKKYDEMIKLLEDVKSQNGAPLLQGFVIDQLATAYDAKQEYPKAIALWQTIEADARFENLKGIALVKAGLAYEKSNQIDKAEQSYKKAESLNSDQNSQRLAKRYLRALKRKKTT